MLCKKLTLLLISTLFLIDVFGQRIVEDANVEQRKLSASFSSISISGNLEAWISQDATESLAVSADKIVVRDAITTEVKNGVLHITGGRTRRKGRVYLSFKTLESLHAAGLVSLNVVGSIRQESLLLSVTGVSDFSGTVSLQKLKINLSGVSNIKIFGETEEVTITCSGTSSFEGIDLAAQKATVFASGTSEVEIGVSSELTVTASGTSEVVYRGQQPVVNKTLSGTSTLRKAHNKATANQTLFCLQDDFPYLCSAK